MPADPIRPATAADAAPLAALAARAFSAAFGPDNRPEDLARYVADHFNPTQLAAELADPAATFLVTHRGARLTGYAKLHDGPPPECVTARPALELVRLYVDPEAIGTGLGSALMAASLARAGERGAEAVWLGVWEHNARALRFYRKWGFAEVGRHDFTLGDDVQTDLIMIRRVP